MPPAGQPPPDQQPPADQQPPPDFDASGFALPGQLRVGNVLADTGTVVLHRVSAFFTGEVDSATVGPDGAFQLHVANPPAPDGTDVYFVSARWDEVVYFGPAVTAPPQPGAALYIVQAYPTAEASAAPPLVRVRNLFLEPADPGPGWRAMDLFELRNASAATLVSGPEGATWSYSMPPGAVEFAVGESDLSPDATSFSDGRVHVSSALRPGESVYLFRYRLPGDVVRIPLEGATASMELLVREPAGDVVVEGLAAVEPVELDGGTYRRFAGREMAPATVVLRPRSASAPVASIPTLAAALAVVLAVAGAFAAMRVHRRRALPVAAARRKTVLEIAELDEAMSAGKVGAGEYQHRREQLLRRLDR